ncbi:GAF domain-containing protein [Lentilitoribacter sp. EG35]|uniref:GAF domain-containing protein n=1 Tax=Lentilitoribacter sp. EG35 TaxID=3234192 RepID=UPI0034603DA0
MRHEDLVLSTVESRKAAAHSSVAASWSRSVQRYGLDPSGKRCSDIVDEQELSYRREAMEQFLQIASPKLDRLFGLVSASGCAVFLTDNEGVILDQRCKEGDLNSFQSWGLMAGADWSEQSEGTNGIGTCIAEDRSLIIHRDQHFFSKNTAMSCIDTPVYGSDGRIMGALNISSARADQTAEINKMIAAMVSQSAKQIESDNFRATFSGARITLLNTGDTEKNALIAIDTDDVAIGATRDARQLFGWEKFGEFAPMAARDIFGGSDDKLEAFDRAQRAAMVRALTRSSGNVSQAARALNIGRATMYRRMKRFGLI